MPSETINSISPDLRDYLLNKNLIPFTGPMSLGYPVAGGLGHPTSIELKYPLASESLTTIDDNDDAHRDLHIVLNPYKSIPGYDEITVATSALIGNSNVDYLSGGPYAKPATYENSPLDDIVVDFPFGGSKPINYLTTQNLYADRSQMEDAGDIIRYANPITEQLGSYLDEHGNVRGLPSTTIPDLIGTLVSGRQLSFSLEGIQPNYDIRGSLAGRLLSPVIGDTPLGVIGAQSLISHMLANAAANIQEDTLGRINLHGLFRKNEDLIIPNYEITKRNGVIGGIKDIFEKISGAQLLSDNMIKPDGSMIDGEDNSQALLDKYTGRGQLNALFFNLG